jgi:lipid kinase YegS
MSELRPHGEVRLILHGGKFEPPELRGVLETLRGQGYAIHVSPTFEAGDAARLAWEAGWVGCEGVIAGGGDGLLHEVVAGLLTLEHENRPWLGVLPMGTGNDFAAAAAVPLDDVEAALELALEGRLRSLDVLAAGGRPVLNMATGGAATGITAETPEALKALLGRVAYVLVGLGRADQLRPHELHLRGPDLEWRGQALAYGVANGRTAGGGVDVAPDARADDGLLDVAVLPHPGIEEQASLLQLFLDEGLGDTRDVLRWRVPWVELSTTGNVPLRLSLDGEPETFEGGSVKLEVLEGALHFRAPPGSPLFGGR